MPGLAPPVAYGDLAGMMQASAAGPGPSGPIPGMIPGRQPLTGPPMPTGVSMPAGGGTPPMPPPGAAGPTPAGMAPQGAAGMPGAPGAGISPQVVQAIAQAIQRMTGRPATSQEIMAVLQNAIPGNPQNPTLPQAAVQAPGAPAPMVGPGMTGAPPVAPPPPSTSGLLRS